MARTWGEIKTDALQLMFSHTSHGVVLDAETNADYVIAMPNAANYALRDLASVSTILYDTVRIAQYAPNNLYQNGYEEAYCSGGTTQYELSGAHSVYFEVDNPCAINIKMVCDDGSEIVMLRETNALHNQYAAYRATNETDGKLVVTLTSQYPYTVRNLAMYGEIYSAAENVPEYAPFIRYDLNALAARDGLKPFMRLDPNMVTRTFQSALIRSDQYFFCEPSSVLLSRALRGQFDIKYCAYPTQITAKTPDTFTPELPDEALDIVPIYIASRLYAEDDISQATLYLNQYMTRRAELSALQPVLGDGTWTSESGWIW